VRARGQCKSLSFAARACRTLSILLGLAVLLAPLEASADRTATAVVIERLIGELDAPDRETRLAAAWALIEIGSEAKVAVPALITLLDDRDGEIRVAAISAMERIASDANIAVPALIGALDDPDPNVRYAAAGALEQFSNRANVVVPALIDALYDPEEIVVYASANALTRMGVLAVPALVETLSSDQALPRTAAAGALGGIGLRAQSALGELVELVNDRDPRVRVAAVRAVGLVASETETGLRANWDEGVEEIPVFPRASDWAARRRLDMFRSNVKLARFAVPPLTDALRDPQEEVRFAAAKALKAIGAAAQDAAPELIYVLEDDAPKVRRAAAGAVGWLAPPDEGVPALVPLLADDDTTVRWTVARVLGEYGSHAVPDLVAALEHDNPVLRVGAAEVLGEIGPAASGAETALESARDDAEDTVRHAAATALDKINGDP